MYTNDLYHFLSDRLDSEQMKVCSEQKLDEMTHLNLPLDDYSVVKIHTNELKLVMMIRSYLNRLSSPVLPAHEQRHHCKLHRILWF